MGAMGAMGTMPKGWKKVAFAKITVFQNWLWAWWALWAWCQTVQKRWNLENSQFSKKGCGHYVRSKIGCGHLRTMCTCRYWYSWHFRLCLWQKVSAEEQGKWKSVSPKFILFSDEVVAAYFDWPIGAKDSTCVVEITAANFAAFLCFDLPNKILDFASKCFQFRWIQLDFRTKQIPVFFACWYHSLELLLFSLIFSHVFGSLLLPGIAAGRR